MAEIPHLKLGNKHGLDELEAPVHPPWRSLLPAIALSLLAHAVLLLKLHLPHAAQVPRAALVVSLRESAAPVPAAVPSVAPVVVPAAGTAGGEAPAPRPASPLEPPVRSAVQAPVQSPAVPPVQSPMASPVLPPAVLPLQPAGQPPVQPFIPAPAPTTADAAARESAAGRRQATFHPAEELARAPLPEANPELGEFAAKLVSRRLRVSVWVDPVGSVQQAVVEPNELTQEQVALLERAIAQVRFTPARDQDDAAAAAVLRTLLCFDDAGRLDVVSDECWKPQPAPAR